MNSIQLSIKEICEKENINFNLISNDWVIVLEKNGETHYIIGTKFDLNNYVSARICNDKYACYDALKYHNIPVCEYHIFYEKDSEEDINNYFNSCNKNVVLKPNHGSYGDNVFHITDFNELLNTMKKLFKNNYSVSISPFYNIICEYRNIVLNNKVELIIGKKKPVVIGDGIHTVYELLRDFNYPFFSKLEDHSKLDYILEEGKEFEYSWKYNISKGAIPIKVEDEDLKKKLSELACEATKKLNLNFVSVDIVELDNHELKIIEINSGVVTNIAEYFEDGNELADELYSKAVLAMFEK